MKLVVIGATGGAGSQVVEQALAGGHTVTALVRRPAAVTLRHQRLEIVQGDVFEPATLIQPIRGKDADWTIVRPPRLTNGPRTGQYHMAVNKRLARGWFISRADLADYIITHLEDPQTYCAQVEVAY